MKLPHTPTQRLAAVAALLALAASCSSLKLKQEDWTGHQIRELIARRGPADRIVPYPYGGTLYIWEKPEAVLEPAEGGFSDDSAAAGAFVHREVVLVSDAGVILQSQVTTERPGAR